MDTHSPFSPFTFPHTARTLDETARLSLLNITLTHSNGTTLTDEIQCYSIPYGLVGFISHLASYYTLIITALGRKPLRPWRPLKSENRILTIIQLLGTVALASYTIYACHNRWQFILIAVWKLLWNAEKAVWQMMAGWKVSRLGSIDDAHSRGGLNELAQINLGAKAGSVDKNSHNMFLGLLNYYNAAAIIGLVGIGSLVKLAAHQTPHVLLITEVFGGVVAFVLVLGIVGVIISCVDGDVNVVNLLFLLPLLAVAVLFALYSDWILAAVASNLLGNPRENKVFYWAYFAFKHLALLTT